MSTEAQTPAENSAPAAPKPQAPAPQPDAQTPEEPQAQAQAPAQPQDNDPNIVGHLSEEEMGMWQQNQRASQGLVNEIGNLVVKVVRGVGQINQLEASTEGMLKAAVGRLGLAEDTRFQVMRDGRIRVIAVPKPATPPPPASGEIDTDEGQKAEDEAPKGAAAVARAKAAAAAAAAKEAAQASTEEPPAPAPTASPPAETPPAEAPAS